MNTHTPTPWEVTPNGGIAGSGENIVTNSPETLSKFGGLPINDGFGRGKANAEHIVRCVNSHDALLAACQAMLPLVDGLWRQLGDSYDCAYAHDMAKEAIAKATGQQIPAPAISENLNHLSEESMRLLAATRIMRHISGE